ncbi:hypothetical protein [Maricaulis sp.]|uniref:hypothetical protein n=1 Tax=Maricaulis sp. TaxID=1486257 RepID=UPI003299077E
MTGFRRFLVALAACSFVAGCASAPISVSSRFAGAGEASPQQASVSRTAADFEDTARARGWIREAGSMETAMSWMGRLAGQSDDEAGTDRAPVARYLEANETTLDAPGFAAHFLTDMTLAWELAGAVDNAAAELIAQGGGVSRSALSRSIGDVETVTARARDTLALFDAVLAEMPVPGDEELASQLVSERDLFAVRTDSLRERVDELVDLRRSNASDDSLS